MTRTLPFDVFFPRELARGSGGRCLYYRIASLCVQIFVLSLNVSNRINSRNILSLVRKDEIHNENPSLFQSRRKWDCVWPKRAISGSPIYPVARKFFKNVPTLVLHGIYTEELVQVRSGLTPNAQICIAWLPGLRLRSFKACRTSL